MMKKYTFKKQRKRQYHRESTMLKAEIIIVQAYTVMITDNLL